MFAMGLADQRMIRVKRGRIVIQAGNGTETLREPACSVTPSLTNQILRGSPYSENPVAIRCSSRQPPTVVGETTMKRTQGAT